MQDLSSRRAAPVRGRVLTRPPLLDRSAYRAWTRVTVRWNDADRYGHVNNTVYYQWFDDAVNGWLIGRGLLDLAGTGPIGFVAETRCRYAHPLDFPGAVEIGLCAVHVGTSSVRYRLGVFAEGSEAAAAEGEFVHVYVDRQSRRPLPLQPAWREALAELAN